jgi:enterochelin esterase family protein
MLLVMPDASTRYGGSQYVNSSATGDYEDHILELVAHIDANYRTIANSEHRAVMGHSSGGFGALWLSMRHPGLFGLVADHSGDKYFELVYQPEFGDLLRFYERAGEAGLSSLLENPGEALRNGAPFGALSVVAFASCYSPNPKSTYGFDFPFDLHSGELRPDVWARWKSFDPVEMVADHSDALKSLRLLFFDCGRFDEYNLLYGARIFAQRLKEHKIDYTYQEFDDGHRNIRYRYDVSLAAISSAMP